MATFFSTLRSQVSTFKSLRNRIAKVRSRKFRHLVLESLEGRQLMAANPVARDDSGYYTALNTDLVVSTSSVHLLANDIDIDTVHFTSSVVNGPTSGTLISTGTNGTFTYRPNTGFTGVDTFTYKINDGSLDSNVATVSIAVGTPLLAKQNLEANVLLTSSQSPRPEGNLVTGDLSLSEQVTPDQILTYRGQSLTKPIVVVDTQLTPGIAVPDAITAQLTFNGSAGTSYSYDVSSLVSGQSLRFAVQADGSSLATGMYDYTLRVSTTTGGVTTHHDFVGKRAIVNRSDSEFGSGWWLD